jgi:hypothetical protein
MEVRSAITKYIVGSQHNCQKSGAGKLAGTLEDHSFQRFNGCDRTEFRLPCCSTSGIIAFGFLAITNVPAVI